MIYAQKMYLCFLAAFCLMHTVEAQKDLEDFTQEFVCETKQIVIPQCPHAFNASIVKWQNQWLMSFRVISDTQQISSISSATLSEIGLIWLDDEFSPAGEPQFLQLTHPTMQRPYLLSEDPRLIVHEEKLYLVYSANKEANITNEGFRMYVAELKHDENEFYVVNNECLSSFEGEDANKREKNWVPFSYENELLLAYQLFPHKIFKPLLDGSEHCETVATSYPSLIWQWGELRGGTPAIQINDDYYLSFFHSSMPLATKHSNDCLVPHYFIGAYLFSSKPPFEIKHISPEPIIGVNFYNGTNYEPYWQPVRVVFPCGVIVEDQDVRIIYGRQDHEIWMAKLNKLELLNSLIHLSTLPE